MSFVSRFKSPTAVKQFLDSPDGIIFVGYFTEMHAKAIRQLRKSNELKEVFYAQGAADVSDRIVKLREEIIQYQNDIASGKIKSGDQSKEEKSDGILEQE
jgi:hypothetical protein